MSPIFVCEIPGRCMVKKNTQRVVGYGSKKRAKYSQQFLFWQRVAELTLAKRRVPMITEKIEFHIQFYFKNRRAEPDVSNLVEGPQDVLTKMGIIKDDRIIQRLVAEKIFDTGDEKTAIQIFHYK